jgi:hypothetical protein
MCNFAHEGHGAVTEAIQGLEGDGAGRVARAVVVTEVLLQFSSALAPGGAEELSNACS